MQYFFVLLNLKMREVLLSHPVIQELKLAVEIILVFQSKFAMYLNKIELADGLFPNYKRQSKN